MHTINNGHLRKHKIFTISMHGLAKWGTRLNSNNLYWYSHLVILINIASLLRNNTHQCCEDAFLCKIHAAVALVM